MQVRYPKRILVPYDGLEKTIPSVNYAVRIAGILQAELVVVHIVTSQDIQNVKDALDTSSDDEAEAYCKRRFENLFKNIEEINKSGLSVRTLLKFTDSVAEGIKGLCRDEKIDMVITRKSTSISKSENNLTKILVSLNLLDVLVYKHELDIEHHKKSVLIPVDNRRGNLSCVCLGVGIAQKCSGEIIFYYAKENEEILNLDNCPEDVLVNIKIAEKLAKDNNVSYRIKFESKQYVEGILGYAVKSSVDLIVMRSFEQTKLMGSLSTETFAQLKESSRENVFFGDAASEVEEQSEHNFIYSIKGRECNECHECVR